MFINDSRLEFYMYHLYRTTNFHTVDTYDSIPLCLFDNLCMPKMGLFCLRQYRILYSPLVEVCKTHHLSRIQSYTWASWLVEQTMSIHETWSPLIGFHSSHSRGLKCGPTCLLSEFSKKHATYKIHLFVDPSCYRKAA